MNIYAEWFDKSVVVAATLPIKSDSMKSINTISEFLTRMGYRDASRTDTTINALRGHKLMNLINVGDPRRNYHTTEVAVGTDAVDVKTQVDSWYGLGTEHDKAVFAVEIEMLRHFLQTGEFSLTPLQEAQVRRRKSDIKTFLLGLGIVILFGFFAVVAIILMKVMTMK